MTAPTTPATSTEGTPPATPASPQNGTDAIAPERTPEVSKPETKTFTQDEVNALITARLERAEKSWAEKHAPKTDPTAEERIAQLEAAVREAQEQATRSAILAQASDFVKPEAVLRFLDLSELSADKPAAIATALDELRASEPYLVKATDSAGTGPRLAPTPGTTTPGNAKVFLSAQELEAITPEELAADPKKMALYIESKAQLGLS